MTPQSRTSPGAPPSNPKREAQALADRALVARKKTEALALAQRALELDGECTDAQVLLAREGASSPKDLTARLKIILDRAEAKLGAPFLQEHRSQLWAIPEARPYLRARLALAVAHEKSGKPGAAIPHLEELLAIDAQDHLGARYRLVCCLLAVNDLKALAALLRRWEVEASAFMAWAALLERIRAKAGKGAESALIRARQVNPHFEEYLTGRRMMPKQIPASRAPGSPEEAASALRLFGETWANDREGMYWLFRHG
jgi:hypothetical protein